MAWLSSISVFGEIFGKILDRIPDPVARAKAAEAMAEAERSGDLEIAKGQMRIGEIEAASPSFWVSGARPALMWICAFGVGYQFCAYPFLVWGAKLAEVDYPPELDAGQLFALVTGMLGLGAQRTFEKTKGVATNQSPVSRAAALTPPAKQ